MDKVEKILQILKDLQKVWYDDTELGYLIKVYENAIKEEQNE